MRVDICNDVFNCYGINQPLKGVLLSVDLVVLLDLEELTPLCIVFNFWVKDIRIGKPLAVGGVVPGSKTYFGLSVDKR